MNIEDLLFNVYKDKIFKIEKLRAILENDYHIKNPYELIVKIVNYQIDKYGEQLHNYYVSKSDLDLINNRYRRRYASLNQYYKNRRYKK